MNSNNINFLYSIVEAFNIAQESLKVAKQIVKNQSKYQRSVLEKMPTLTTSSAPQNLLNDSLREIEDLKEWFGCVLKKINAEAQRGKGAEETQP